MEAVEGLIAPGSADRRARSETREFNNRQRSKSEGARGIDLSSLMKAPKIFNLAREARQAKREVKKLRDRTRDYLEDNYEGELGDSACTPGYLTPPSPRISPTPPFLDGRENNLNMELLLKRVQALEGQREGKIQLGARFAPLNDYSGAFSHLLPTFKNRNDFSASERKYLNDSFHTFCNSFRYQNSFNPSMNFEEWFNTFAQVALAISDTWCERLYVSAILRGLSLKATERLPTVISKMRTADEVLNCLYWNFGDPFSLREKVAKFYQYTGYNRNLREKLIDLINLAEAGKVDPISFISRFQNISKNQAFNDRLDMQIADYRGPSGELPPEFTLCNAYQIISKCLAHCPHLLTQWKSKEKPEYFTIHKKGGHEIESPRIRGVQAEANPPPTQSIPKDKTNQNRFECYQCGDPSHMIRECPKRTNKWRERCELCGSTTHKAPFCTMYVKVQTVPKPCEICIRDMGYQLFHPPNVCKNNQKIRTKN